MPCRDLRNGNSRFQNALNNQPAVPKLIYRSTPKVPPISEKIAVLRV
jgi:hypothetical protein